MSKVQTVIKAKNVRLKLGFKTRTIELKIPQLTKVKNG